MIDFEPVASDELLVVGEEGSTELESQEGESSQVELQGSALVVSPPSESQPAPGDVAGITDDRLQTADAPLPLKSEHLKLNTPTIDSQTEGSIEARGPPTEIVFIDSSLNLDFQLENAVPLGVVVSVYDATTDGIQHITDVLSSYSDLSAIHFLSHGAPGLATFGTATLHADTLERYANRIRTCGQALTADGDILFYGERCKRSMSRFHGRRARDVVSLAWQ